MSVNINNIIQALSLHWAGLPSPEFSLSHLQWCPVFQPNIRKCICHLFSSSYCVLPHFLTISFNLTLDCSVDYFVTPKFLQKLSQMTYKTFCNQQILLNIEIRIICQYFPKYHQNYFRIQLQLFSNIVAW